MDNPHLRRYNQFLMVTPNAADQMSLGFPSKVVDGIEHRTFHRTLFTANGLYYAVYQMPYGIFTLSDFPFLLDRTIVQGDDIWLISEVQAVQVIDDTTRMLEHVLNDMRAVIPSHVTGDTELKLLAGYGYRQAAVEGTETAWLPESADVPANTVRYSMMGDGFLTIAWWVADELPNEYVVDALAYDDKIDSGLCEIRTVKVSDLLGQPQAAVSDDLGTAVKAGAAVALIALAAQI